MDEIIILYSVYNGRIGKIICMLHNHYNNHKFEVFYYFSELPRANYDGQMGLMFFLGNTYEIHFSM